jgi:metallo-beta-lactamase family protein
MKITFHGAARTVTGSQYLLEINGYKLLLECGLFQGKRAEFFECNRHFRFDPKELDAVILSHAHIDHSGNLPNLIKKGYHKSIYATPATSHLANIMLMDSGHIHESDANYVNEKRRKKGLEPIEPLYTLEDAAQVAQHFLPTSYNQPFYPIPGVEAQLIEAGHILGSAAIVLDIEEKLPYKNNRFRLWFSGDIGRRDLPLIRDPILPTRTDYLMMECTYGDKSHRDPQEAFDEFRQVVIRTINRGGKVIIPAFAVGRTQELVYDLHIMMDNGEIPKIPVFVDSPLAVSATDIFRSHPECFDQETRAFIANDKNKAALGFEMLTYTRSVEESKALNYREDPMIIISASGMAEAGRILHHLKNNIEDPRNTILIVSWQAPHTLGRRLADREKEIRIFGEKYHRKAEVDTIGGLSAHAGQNLLLEYAQSTQDTLKQVYLVHGEERGAEALMEKMRQSNIEDVFYPELHTSVEI